MYMYDFCIEFLEVLGVSSTLEDFKWVFGKSKYNFFLILPTIDDDFNGVWGCLC